LSDLFIGIAKNSDKVIALSPSLGKRLKLRFRDIQKIARQSELFWKPQTKRRSIIIERASRQVSLDILREVIENELASKVLSYEVEIDFSNPKIKILIPYNEQPTIKIHDLKYDERTKFFRAIISSPAEMVDATTISLKGRAHPVIAMPVLKQHINSGNLIKASNVIWKKTRAQHNSYDSINSMEQLVDQVARRPLMAGRIIRVSDVRPQRLVTKGDFVTVHLRNQSMSLTTRGISIESGSRNEIIKIRNPRSKKIIEAKIIAPNVAIIQLSTLSFFN
jgi:flagella basal body P-ring formation protein FlgA